MVRKEIEYLLFSSEVTAWQISWFTDISTDVINQYKIGELNGNDMQRGDEIMLSACFEDYWSKCCTEFGYIIHNDVMIAITKDPEPVMIDGELFSETLGLDEEGNTHPILWDC